MTILLERFKSETALITEDKKLSALQNKIENVIQEHSATNKEEIVLNTEFNIDGKLLKLFSTMTELGAVQEISVGGFKVELMFPLDDETEEYFHSQSK